MNLQCITDLNLENVVKPNCGFVYCDGNFISDGKQSPKSLIWNFSLSSRSHHHNLSLPTFTCQDFCSKKVSYTYIYIFMGVKFIFLSSFWLAFYWMHGCRNFYTNLLTNGQIIKEYKKLFTFVKYETYITEYHVYTYNDTHTYCDNGEQGAVEEWHLINFAIQCNTYDYNVKSVVDYHRNLTKTGLRVLIYG